MCMSTSYDDSQRARDADGKYAPMTTADTATDVLDGSDVGDDSMFTGDVDAYNVLEREERAELMKKDLENAVNEVINSGKLGAYLDARAANRMGHWSMGNRLLATSQVCRREGITGFRGFFERMNTMDCGTVNQWRKRGRYITTGKGSSLYINAPITRMIEEDDPHNPGKKRKRQIVLGMTPSSTFDVSMTEGDPVPQSPSQNMPEGTTIMEGTNEGLVARISEHGYAYEEREITGFDPKTMSGTQGYTDPRDMKVVVDNRLPPAEKSSVIAHELGHIEMGHVKDLDEYREHRGRMETEADSFAYLMLRNRGVTAVQSESFSPGYIAGWAGKDTKKMTKAIDDASKKFTEVLTSLKW